MWLLSRQPLLVNDGPELVEARQLLAGILTVGASGFLICGVRCLEMPPLCLGLSQMCTMKGDGPGDIGRDQTLVVT